MMLSEAKWFFELGNDRFKMVSLKRTEEKTLVSVVVYDDLGVEVSRKEDQLELKAPFVCRTFTAEVAFEIDGLTYRY